MQRYILYDDGTVLEMSGNTRIAFSDKKIIEEIKSKKEDKDIIKTLTEKYKLIKSK